MTTNHERWKVAQHILSKMWVAWNDGDMKENPIHLADRTVRAFRTHAEALAYADRMARTVEVTLPRNPLPLKLQGEEGDIEIVIEQNPKKNNVTISDEYQRDMIVLHRFELQPLALALLAHHYRSTTP